MYDLSIIIPIIDEFDSLKKTYNIVNSIGRDKKEFLVKKAFNGPSKI